MGDNIYNNTNSCSFSSTAEDHRSSDEISLFLHQILLHSSSSPSSSMMTSSSLPFHSYSGQHSQSFTAPLSFHRGKDGGISSGLDSRDGLNAGIFSGNVHGSAMAAATNASSSLTIGGAYSENETDCDCESEEGLEALAEEVIPVKRGNPRSSSKRSRAAEVHNLSEKRRRSRINEKMKTLQNLIPNSNKTDKASMLDEAIEYLKQLQLQVQMLSIRNGVSLHPMCLPGLLQPIQVSQLSRGFDEEIGTHHLNITSSNHLPVNQENQDQIIFNLPNQCPVSNQLSVPHLINSGTSFGVESSIRTHFGPFPLRAPTELKEICREEDVQPHQLHLEYSERIPSELEMGNTSATAPPHFEIQSSNFKESSSLGTCMIGRDQSESIFLKNMEHNLSNLQGTGRETSVSSDEIKLERRKYLN